MTDVEHDHDDLLQRALILQRLAAESLWPWKTTSRARGFGRRVWERQQRIERQRERAVLYALAREAYRGYLFSEFRRATIESVFASVARRTDQVTERRGLLAVAVREGMHELRLSTEDLQARSGLELSTILGLQRGTMQTCSPEELGRIERVLEWPGGIIRGFLEGGAESA